MHLGLTRVPPSWVVVKTPHAGLDHAPAQPGPSRPPPHHRLLSPLHPHTPCFHSPPFLPPQFSPPLLPRSLPAHLHFSVDHVKSPHPTSAALPHTLPTKQPQAHLTAHRQHPTTCCLRPSTLPTGLRTEPELTPETCARPRTQTPARGAPHPRLSELREGTISYTYYGRTQLT